MPFYTDGSKKEMPLGTIGAYHIHSRHNNEYCILNPNISIEGAELSAITKTTDWISSLDEHPKQVIFFTDSKISLFLKLNRKPKAAINMLLIRYK